MRIQIDGKTFNIMTVVMSFVIYIAVLVGVGYGLAAIFCAFTGYALPPFPLFSMLLVAAWVLISGINNIIKAIAASV